MVTLFFCLLPFLNLNILEYSLKKSAILCTRYTICPSLGNILKLVPGKYYKILKTNDIFLKLT